MTQPNETTSSSDNHTGEDAYVPVGGEDESSASHGDDDEHLREDQKPINGTTKKADEVADDDPHKAEKLTAAGREVDPDEGSE